MSLLPDRCLCSASTASHLSVWSKAALDAAGKEAELGLPCWTHAGLNAFKWRSFESANRLFAQALMPGIQTTAALESCDALEQVRGSTRQALRHEYHLVTPCRMFCRQA